MGFLDLELANSVLLKGLRLMCREFGPWLGMPAYELLDKEGQPNTHFVPQPVHAELIEFQSPPAGKRVTALVFEQIYLTYPAALQPK